jgi:hypothetical protein
MLQTIFNYTILIFLLISNAHLIWQFTNVSKEMKEIRLQIGIAMVINTILLLLNLFVIF